MAALTQGDEVRLGGGSPSAERDYVMHLNPGLSTDLPVDNGTALTAVPLENLRTDVPPGDLPVGVRVAVTANSFRTAEEVTGAVLTKHKIVDPR
jgi:hypothetical protein